MTGGIVLDQSQPFFVHHDGSTAVLYGVKETDETRAAAVEMIELLAVEPTIVVIDYRTATVHAFTKASVA